MKTRRAIYRCGSALMDFGLQVERQAFRCRRTWSFLAFMRTGLHIEWFGLRIMRAAGQVKS